MVTERAEITRRLRAGPAVLGRTPELDPFIPLRTGRSNAWGRDVGARDGGTISIRSPCSAPIGDAAGELPPCRSISPTATQDGLEGSVGVVCDFGCRFRGQYVSTAGRISVIEQGAFSAEWFG